MLYIRTSGLCDLDGQSMARDTTKGPAVGEPMHADYRRARRLRFVTGIAVSFLVGALETGRTQSLLRGGISKEGRKGLQHRV